MKRKQLQTLINLLDTFEHDYKKEFWNDKEKNAVRTVRSEARDFIAYGKFEEVEE